MDYRSVASVVSAQTGWRAVFLEPAPGGHAFRFHHVFAWGLILERKVPSPSRRCRGTYVPMSMSGDVLSHMDGYLGIIDPTVTDDEAVEEFAGPAAELELPFSPPK